MYIFISDCRTRNIRAFTVILQWSVILKKLTCNKKYTSMHSTDMPWHMLIWYYKEKNNEKSLEENRMVHWAAKGYHQFQMLRFYV